MKRSRRFHPLAAAGLGLAILVLAVPTLGDAAGRARTGQDGDPVAADCCYTNPQYAGVCVVQPGEGETCSSILAYLNNPRSQGKSYCGSTSIRGGWRQAACPER